MYTIECRLKRNPMIVGGRQHHWRSMTAGLTGEQARAQIKELRERARACKQPWPYMYRMVAA